MISPRLRAAVIASAAAAPSSPGAMPAYASATATPTASATLNTTHPVDYPAVVTPDDKIFMVAWMRAVSSTTLALHADAIAAGFSEVANFGSQRVVLIAVKDAVGDEDGTTLTNAITSTGSGGQECFFATMFRVTAANGFHPVTPIRGLATSDGTNSTIPGPSLTPDDTNQLGVCVTFIGNDVATAAFTGATGGTGAWTERLSVGTATGTDAQIQVQTIDLSGGAGDAVSGGSFTIASSQVYRQAGFLLVPANT